MRLRRRRRINCRTYALLMAYTARTERGSRLTSTVITDFDRVDAWSWPTPVGSWWEKAAS